MARNRNEPCPCGSGKKYKVCCANKRTTSQWAALASVVVFALLAVWAVAGVLHRVATEKPLEAPAGQVWSEEHGHYHEGQNPAPRPLVPTPPGKVWSEEHGHWHDADAERPSGPTPAGQVWSEEHGHYHDAPGFGEAAPAVGDDPLLDPPVSESP